MRHVTAGLLYERLHPLGYVLYVVGGTACVSW